MNFTLTTDEVKGFTPEQRRAVLDALVAAVLADGKTDAVEIAKFEAEVIAIPWGLDEQTLLGMVKEAQKDVLALKSRDDVIKLIKDVSSRLPDVHTREKVFFAMASIMYADKIMNDAEKNLLGAFALAFGLSKDVIVDVAKQVKGA
jgi:uncharacterized tellurite resistance protein B-like protein